MMSMSPTLPSATVSKTVLLASLETKVEKHLQEAISLFQNLTAEELSKPAPDGGWSIAQCLDHLNGYGDHYLPHIDKGLSNAVSKHAVGNAKDTDDSFRSSWLGRRFTKMMDPQTGKKKMKAFKNHLPAPDLDPHSAVAVFIRQQETLISYLRRAAGADLNHIRVPTSIAKFIRLHLADVFQFLIAHNERHVQQAKRNLI